MNCADKYLNHLVKGNILSNNCGEYTLDIILFDQDGITAEVDFYFQAGIPNAESDWDCQDYLEVYEYRCFSGTKEIHLDLDSQYLHNLVLKEIRSLQLKRSMSEDY